MFAILKYEHNQFKGIEGIYSILEDIAKPSYKNVSLVLRKEFDFCNILYLGLLDEVPVCFYLVADEVLKCQDKELHAIYLGLSATNSNTKSRGYIIKLYKRCLHDTTQKYDSNNIKFWGTTINPTVYAVASKYLDNIQPRIDGSYDNNGLKFLECLKMSGYWSEQSQKVCDINPFVLREYANARYTDFERNRMLNLGREMPLFNALGLSETKGDRIIFVGSPPQEM